MKKKLLNVLLLFLTIFTLSAQSKVKKGTVIKKTIKKTLVKTEIKEEPEIIDAPIIEEAPESNPLKIKYRRSSLYTVMVETPNIPFADSIKKYFITSKIPDKFNNHNLDKRVLESLPGIIPATAPALSSGNSALFKMASLSGASLSPSTSSAALLSNITSSPYLTEYQAERKKLTDEAKEIGVTKKNKITEYVDKRIQFDNQRYQKELADQMPQELKDQIKETQKGTDDIARELVAKWFGRSLKGGFNMNLIKSRGNYDASVLDIAKARASKRGLTMLGDAGEDLIKNTFVLINEFKYTDKEVIAKKTNKWLNIATTAASYAGVPHANTIVTVATAVSVGVTIAGKGYIVKTKAHLYRLDWNEEVAAKFYNDLWATDRSITPEKKKAFDESDIFKLVYIGTDDSWADVQSSIFTNKTDVKLVERATLKAMDAVVVKLQKNHDEFKTKTPIYTNEPLTAKIGLKEGLNEKSIFDVLEQQIDENGIPKYVNVGVLKVDTSFPIWDNRYGADVENPITTTDKTYFKKVSGKDFYPGMLLVQKKGK